MEEVDVEEAVAEEEPYNPKVRWCNPHSLEVMTFVGNHVFAVANDIYIIFFNYRTNTETVYLANDQENGDGVDALAGHRSHMFAFAEKTINPRIFIAMYPTFTILAEIKETDTKRYKALVMMEGDLIAGFTGFPNYLLTVWCWRTNQRLCRVKTSVMRRKQMYLASRTHMLICQCWGEGLNVWEVARCYKKCFILKRPRTEITGWEIKEAMLTGACWGLDGILYVIDPKANLFSMSPDGIGLNKVLEWSDESIEGKQQTSLCSFLSGVLIYGPDEHLRYLKKQPESKTWKVEWSFIPNDVVARLVSNSICDMATMWTETGFVYKITADSEEKIEVNLFTIKQRNIMKIQLIPPDYNYIALMNTTGVLSIYEVENQRLVLMKLVKGDDVSFTASPVEPVLAIFGEVLGGNYGVSLYTFNPDELDLKRNDQKSLTHQIVSLVAFAPDGRFIVAAAISAGHVFIFKVSHNLKKLFLTRYMELGRGLADCFLMMVGKDMRCFSLLLFSEKYSIGERIICVNAETGQDNKFAGKMHGPYTRLLPLSTKDTMLAIPHLSKQMHILRLAGDKGPTISVKMGPIIDTGHDIKQFDAFRTEYALLTFGFDGTVILRDPTCPENYELKMFVTHRYFNGVKSALIDGNNRYIVHIGANGTVACVFLRDSDYPSETLEHYTPDDTLYEMNQKAKINIISIVRHTDKNYLQIQEDLRVQEETTEYSQQREEVCSVFASLQEKLIELLEENINEPPLHQLSLSEFNLHQEAKKERLRAAEKEREEIRLRTEARIRAQDNVTEWIKTTCWDNMKSPRIKLFAIHSHYHVENFSVLPTQRDTWPELEQVEALRAIEMENDAYLFRPWLEQSQDVDLKASADKNPISRSGSRSYAPSLTSFREVRHGSAMPDVDHVESAETVLAQPHVLSGSSVHEYVEIPKCMIPQMEAYSFLQMNWLYELVKRNTQNMRVWFNKQFDELFALKKRELGLVSERNDRLRFIIEELNRLSDLRGSFHHLKIEITDPQWRQEEQVHKLIKVEPEECEIQPYISPSQIVIIPPDPGPKDDFRERALMEMMDGVLEKLWHEEIKKPIQEPLCMLEKEPEQFNEDDLRQVFDYEEKVRFRNDERDKYRKMLHAEYAKLSQVLNEGIVKFNQKVREIWLLKIKTDSIIGQENLNLMRLRRANLDRIEMSEITEDMRDDIARYEHQVDKLNAQLVEIQRQHVECQAAYDALAAKDRHMEKTFKNHFTDMAPIVIEQSYKFFKKRPKWHQRASMLPVVLAELAQAVASGLRPPLLHADVVDYFKGVEALDQISNIPAVLDEHLWATMCRLRRAKIENEIKMRALVQDLAYVEHANGVWHKAIETRLTHLAAVQANVLKHREKVELEARNKTIQLVLPAGQVEIITTGHMEDFEDAMLMPKDDIEKINNLIMKVGEMKLRMMRKQMEFRKGILSKEWEHSQMKMKLKHMQHELYSYKRLKIPKELQRYLKNKELGYTDEQDFIIMEKENEASKAGVDKILNHLMQACGELEVKIMGLEAVRAKLETFITTLNIKVSDKKINEDALEPIRIRRVYKRRMETLVTRSRLIREVQANQSTIVMLQTELELLRLKTYPTLASFCTY